ncbi:YbaB/EbfC family nucleoid-associated protein [Desulfothermobacter acidiphilus]|uniref:YbaB/EbfC family nucleoid-associated protein n=1 Tax=Desulfothermobacter acidiphilus TaxID=1938353 RepID=UPI003F8B4322
MMRQMQKLQADLAKLQEELGNRTTEATAGGGMVRAVVNGKQELVALEIKPEALDPEEAELLQDMVLAAVNEALRQAREMVAQEMGRLTGGLGIPGLV